MVPWICCVFDGNHKVQQTSNSNAFYNFICFPLLNPSVERKQFFAESLFNTCSFSVLHSRANTFLFYYD